MALWGGQARPEPLPEPRLQFRPGEDHSSRPPPNHRLHSGAQGTTHPSSTKKKISGRSKGMSTRKLVL